MIIRPYQLSDLPALHVINQAGVPGVGDETVEGLGKWLGLSHALVATDDADQPLGFITLLPPGTLDYTSANLRWLEAWGDDFIYVDRIAIAETARGQGIGDALYRAAFDAYAGKTPFITCEVNLRPPNPGSLRFHARLGFTEIGRRSYADDTKEVVYLARPLA
ncbi:GNAT family N-acetyltransferase [Hyphomonas johnsonii]|uniref:N-acetyltransferase GCN5 n=1 Tax=Hyphomonas johnsonii MHS-2 TaxID=1280950 RepID=A0A059FP59_9PROT|nr:GNAT family N-acetyltransferase [Hyphomonas johnsonii]KCZ92402.1 N-acetyltransferase GCN5 [Hyphomonas johnsonii MHS-2]